MTENKLILSKYDLAFIGVLAFAVAIRLYFFYITQDQALWWDGAEYMNMAKDFAGTYSAEWWPGRPILLPLIWAGMLKLGLGELSLKFIVTLFSIAGIFFTYLIIKDMYDKKTAIITTLLLSVFWMHLFYSARILVDVPSLTMWTVILYFFWKAVNTHQSKYYALTGILIALGTLLRFPTLIIGAVILIYLLATERHKFLLDKNFWIMGAGSIAIIIPYFIWATLKFGNPIYQFIYGGGAAGQAIGLPSILTYLNLFPFYFQILGIIIFVIGLYMFSDVIMGIDLLNKETGAKIRANFLILLWLLIPLFYFATQTRAEERYIMFIFPAAFLIITRGLFYIENFVKKLNLNLAKIITIVLIVIMVLMQINFANTSIVKSSTSYMPVKDAGIWIKENSPENLIVYTMSVPQIQYYAERTTLSYGGGSEAFDKIIADGKPAYFVLSVFEGHPDWVGNYLATNPALETVRVYNDQNSSPVLIIFGLKN